VIIDMAVFNEFFLIYKINYFNLLES